ncbi:MAG: ImmA/IrrE family metallo-endopeptidase [Acidimicrobiia bacterium]
MQNLTISQIEEKAQELLAKHFGRQFEPPIKVEDLLHRLRGSIEVRYTEEADPESLRIKDDGSFTVFLPINTSYRRDRFTIAHELGHLVLHYPHAEETKAYRRYGQSRQETEANAFAGALLMPEKAFRDFWYEHRHLTHDARLDAVVRQFQVSKSAADVRRQVLNV